MMLHRFTRNVTALALPGGKGQLPSAPTGPGLDPEICANPISVNI